MTHIHKITEIENLLNRLEYQCNQYSTMHKIELIERLQVDCSDMYNMIFRIYSYLEANIFSSLEFDQLKQKAKKVSEKLLETTEELIALGSHRNVELEEFYKDVYFELYKDKAHSQVIINKEQVSELKNHLRNTGITVSIESKREQLTYDPNLWDKDNFELFQYLYENYYRGTIRQLTNIWFYLRERDYNAKKTTKKDYKHFIFSTYNIEIKNFDKAEEKYQTEKPL
jgi:hypothetical protein